MLTARELVLALTVLFGAGFLTPIIFPRRRYATEASLTWGLAGSLLAALVTGAIAFGLRPTLGSTVVTRANWMSVGPVHTLMWEVQVDLLAGFFGLLVSGFSALVAIYSFSALRAEHFRAQRNRIASAFNVFVWSTLLVLFACDGFSLLVTLELMTLAFGYLALYKHTYYEIEGHGDTMAGEQRRNARLAPQVYLIVSHTSTVFLLVAISLLVLASGSLSFNTWIDNAGDLQGLRAWLPPAIFLLALAGLGIRAGLTPAHFWVSLVHPASPTPTHALSLGIAIKVAVYLMYRFFFQFLQPQASWGYVVLLLAGVTALVNVWYAISSHDLKTALAYHSIENVGIIVAPIGAAMIFAGNPSPSTAWLAGLALTASLYHTLNHAVFKGLLYMATGSIDNATHGVVEIDRLGGLIKLYPWTSAAFLVGACAISGLPPLNGFISEWLTLQTLLQGMTALQSPRTVDALVLVGGLLLLVASFALTAFCFYKIVGLALLGQPRLPAAARTAWQKSEAGRPMLAVMAVLAVLCLALGVLPGRVTPWLATISAQLQPGPKLAEPAWSGLVLAPPGVPDAPPLQLPVLAVLGAATLLALVPALLRPGRDARRPEMPWNYGTPFDPATMQPTPASISENVRRLFASPARRPGAAANYLPATTVLSDSEVYPQAVHEVFRETYNRWIGSVLRWSERTGTKIQGGDIRQYLGYIFAANLITLLLFLLLNRQP